MAFLMRKVKAEEVLRVRIEGPSDDIVVLDNTLDPLKDRFNAQSKKIRFLALLSPTCPL